MSYITLFVIRLVIKGCKTYFAQDSKQNHVTQRCEEEIPTLFRDKNSGGLMKAAGMNKNERKTAITFFHYIWGNHQGWTDGSGHWVGSGIE